MRGRELALFSEHIYVKDILFQLISCTHIVFSHKR